MKATGIVRRIDDLGRVVIPKEIRRTMRIREGDPLEIYTNAGGEVIFKKYSPVGELSEMAQEFAQILSDTAKRPVIICDRERCIAAAGVAKKEVLEKPVSSGMISRLFTGNYIPGATGEKEEILEGWEVQQGIFAPILSQGSVNGAVILIAGESGEPFEQPEACRQLAQLAAAFLGRQLGE